VGVGGAMHNQPARARADDCEQLRSCYGSEGWRGLMLADQTRTEHRGWRSSVQLATGCTYRLRSPVSPVALQLRSTLHSRKYSNRDERPLACTTTDTRVGGVSALTGAWRGQHRLPGLGPGDTARMDRIEPERAAAPHQAMGQSSHRKAES